MRLRSDLRITLILKVTDDSSTCVLKTWLDAHPTVVNIQKHVKIRLDLVLKETITKTFLLQVDHPSHPIRHQTDVQLLEMLVTRKLESDGLSSSGLCKSSSNNARALLLRSECETISAVPIYISL